MASAKSAMMQLGKLVKPVLLILALSGLLTGLPASVAELPHHCEAHLCGDATSLEAATPGSTGRPLVCLHEAACAGAAAHGFGASAGLAIVILGVGFALAVPARRWRLRRRGTLRLPLVASQLFRPPRFA